MAATLTMKRRHELPNTKWKRRGKASTGNGRRGKEGSAAMSEASSIAALQEGQKSSFLPEYPVLMRNQLL